MMTDSTQFQAEKINNYIVKWLLDYANNAKVKGFVVGISGGIDSALTSTLCAQTGLPTLCVEMPIHQAESHVDRANQHIDQLKKRFSNVSSERVDLTPTFETFPEYMRIEFDEAQILPDIVSSFSYGKIAPPKDRTLLSLMIYKGKELYMKDLLIPDVADNVKIAYTEDKYKWCEENESQMWSHFIENKLLYDTNPKNEQRFMNEAPFSKFYLEIDNESPGRVGAWLGWQIVRSFMENHPDVKLQELLAMSAKELFEESKYKPKK